MFGNEVKRLSKAIAWKFLRNAQFIVMKSEFCNKNVLIDKSKMILALGAYGIYASNELSLAKIYEDGDTPDLSKMNKSIQYIGKYAPKYVRGLLAQYKLPQLPKSAFTNFYSGMSRHAVAHGKNDISIMLKDAGLFVLIYAAGSSFPLVLSGDGAWDEYWNILRDACMEWGPVLPVSTNKQSDTLGEEMEDGSI